MNKLFSLILCSSAILLTLPTIAEARPRREASSFNPGVHRTLPSSRYSTYNGRSRSNYYERGYQRGYYRGSDRGYGGSRYDRRSRRTYDRGYREDYRYQRNRSRSRIRIEYEGEF
ncbi:MAG: hypothetical protein AB4058_06435 [Microcystaceae cyanobacterium]